MATHPKAEEIVISIEDEDNRSAKFKQFDVIAGNHPEQWSNLSSTAANHSQTQLSSETISLIMKEWSILKDSLPDSIFVRVYKGTIDRLTAIIVGPPGTPYQDGLFIYDIRITAGYPYTCPNIKIFCPRIRNLPRNLVICLKERRQYNILEILLWQQENLTNSKPKRALNHSNDILPTHCEYWLENDISTFKVNCHTMLRILKELPKDFEKFVAEHFRDRAESILVACKIYIIDAESKIASGKHIAADSTTVATKKEGERQLRSMKSIYYRLFKAFMKNGSSSSLENIYDIREISLDDIEGIVSCSKILLSFFVIFLGVVLVVGLLFAKDATYHHDLELLLGLSFLCGLASLLLKKFGCDFPFLNRE